MELSFEQLPQSVAKLSAEIQDLKMLITKALSGEKNNKRIPIDISKAARLVNKSKSTIYRLCCNRQIPHKKKGRNLYFYENELLDWIDNGKVKTTDEIDREVDRFTEKN